MIDRLDFWARHGRHQPNDTTLCRLQAMFEAQYARQLMFTSCAFFFEDFDRIEPRNAIAWAARAVEHVRVACDVSLEANFAHDLAEVRSWRSGLAGDEVYRATLSRRRPIAATAL